MKTLCILYACMAIIGLQGCAGEAAGRTPFCDICTCYNQTLENPDVDCTEKIITYNLYTTTNWYNDETNSSYSISSLNLQFTNLRDLNDTFPTSNLKKLDLSNNSIQHISDGVFQNLQEMETLILSYNEIKVIGPNAFMGLRLDGYDYPLRALKVLRLDHNRIHSLDDDVFQHVDREVEVLSLSHNPLKLIDQNTLIAIAGIINLKNLDLSYTSLKELPEHFLHTPKQLSVLDLSGNYFESVPSTLEDSHILEELIFNDNPIKVLNQNNGFPAVPTLKVLHLCHMPDLTSIDEHALSGLGNLTELHLSDNSALTTLHSNALSKRDVEVEVWPPITKLHINNNKLSRLNNTFILKWSGLSDLDIRNNPWTCECENQWMIDELIPALIKINETEAKEVMCAAPIEMEGQTLYDIHQKRSIMRCLDLYGNRPERDGAILIGVLIGVLIGIPLVLFIIYSYQRNWFGLFDNSPASYSRQFYKPPSGLDADL